MPTDASSFQIVNASGQLQTKTGVTYDYETKSSYSVTVSVTDGKDAQDNTEQNPVIDDTIAVTVTVTNVNDAPVSSAIDDRTLAHNVVSLTDIDLSHYFSDPDTGDTLSYSASSSDTGVATVSVSGSDLTITRQGSGSTLVTVTATDGGGLSVRQRFAVTVEPSAPDKIAVLKAMPGSVHGEIVLDWEPVEGADNYQVGQLRRQTGTVFAWEVLEDSEVTIDLVNTSAVVHGLTAGFTYEHSVQGVRVVGSDVVPGPWADGKTAKAHDESPEVPTGLKGVAMVGGRGITVSWDAAMGAQDYEVELSYAGGITTTTAPSLSIDYTGLVPKATYSFRVRSRKPHGSGHLFSGWSGAVSYGAPKPSFWMGHQADHTVKYATSTIGNTIIEDSIAPSARAWNLKMGGLGKGLTICPASDPACNDNFTVMVTAVDNNNNSIGPRSVDPTEGCGTSRACVKPDLGTLSEYSEQFGYHLGTLHIVFEDPPWFAVEKEDKHGNKTGKWDRKEYMWTDNQSINGDPVTSITTRKVYYVYVGRVMIHEFGHALGLPDFYNDDTGLKDLDGIMNDEFQIGDEDIRQLKAIYLLHNSHSRPKSLK